eukprot:TRINITY_DN35744_c0_g1_i1.p1 TRINITY_DN35744_c0_g1~~TRINITY_DN35744_c0_g1_i1.p1  ORF type:complete len:216 (+),score=41.53 TRINITY_DN35744_c0_g1_i1:328-975(+)
MAPVKEDKTGVFFPPSIAVPGTKELAVLATGFREKKVAIISVKVYGVALYANESETVTAWAPFKGIQAKKLEKDDAFFKVFRDYPGEKALTITLVRDLETKQFTDGLKESLEPRLKVTGGEEGAAALETFIQVFPVGELKSGTRIHLALTSEGTHVTIVPKDKVPDTLMVPEGAKTSLVVSPPLVAALNDVYFGNNPSCPSLKWNLAQKAEAALK